MKTLIIKQKLASILLVIALGTKIVQAQFFTANFEANTIKAPEIYLYNVEKIAILNFQDENNVNWNYFSSNLDYGAKLADYMTSMLLEESRGISPKTNTYFEGFQTRMYSIIERTQIDEVLKEQNLGLSGAIDESQAVQVGKILGIDAIFLGSISYVVDEGTYSKKHKNKDGSIYYTYYAEREVKAEARMKIISVETAEIIGMTTKTASKKDVVKSEGPVSVSATKSVEELANNAYKDVAYDLTEFFAPRFDKFKATLQSIKVKEYKQRAKEICNFVYEGRIDKALVASKELYDEDSYNTNIVFNMGVLYEGTGNFEEAQKAYSIAYELDPDNTDAKNALSRISTTLEVSNYLAETGMPITPYEFQTQGSAVADYVTTGGRKKDRIEIYSQMDRTSAIAAKVPGDTRFEIKEEAGDWYLVKLLGDKEGYLNKEDAR